MSNWGAKKIDGIPVRTLQDPNEVQEMAECAAGWRDYDKVGFDPLVDDMSPEEQAEYHENSGAVDGVPYDMLWPGRPEDLAGWETLSGLERDAIQALDYGESVKETSEILGRSEKSVYRSRDRAREKLWNAWRESWD